MGSSLEWNVLIAEHSVRQQRKKSLPQSRTDMDIWCAASQRGPGIEKGLIQLDPCGKFVFSKENTLVNFLQVWSYYDD
jgi:hypothetical protein